MTDNFLLDCQAMIEENIKAIRREAQKGYRRMGRGAVITEFEEKRLVATSYLPIDLLLAIGFEDEDLRLIIKYEPPMQTVIMAFFREEENEIDKFGFHLINFLEPTERLAKNKGFGKKADKLHEYLDLTKKMALISLTDPDFFTRRSDAIEKRHAEFLDQVKQKRAKQVISDKRQK